MPGRLSRFLLSAVSLAAISASSAVAAPVEIFSMTPAFSPFNVAGRTATIKGIGFTASTAATFGPTAATTTFINSRTLVVTIPTVASARFNTVTFTDPVNGSDQFYPFLHTGPVFYVAITGNDSNAGTSPASPKRTLGAAFAAVDSITPSEVRVSAGLYLESQLELNHGTALSCGWAPGFGQRDPDGNVSEVDAGRTGFVMRTSGLMNVTVIDGCTLTNGLRDGLGGGAVPISADTIVINNNVIAGNTSTFLGGGIYWRATSSYGGKPTFSNNVVVGNRSNKQRGGGISPYAFYDTVEDVDVTISGNHIVGNRSFLSRGGGISFSTGTYIGYNEGKLTIADNVIAHNDAKGGGGLDVSTSNYADLYKLSVKNNLVAGNTVGGGGGGVSLGGLGTYDGEFKGTTIADNVGGPYQGGGFTIGGGVTLAPGFQASDLILWGNSGEDVVGFAIDAIDYSISGTPLSGPGNMSVDPRFTVGQLSNYYLRQNDPNLPDSPAVNAGSGLASDFSLNPITTSTDNTLDSGVNDLGYHALLSIPNSAVLITVTRVDPARGDINGTDWVLVRGDGFDPGAQVQFGGVPATDQIYMGHRRILARPAPRALGFVNVRVFNPDATNATLVSGYLYLDNMPPFWTSTVGVITATGGVDACRRTVLLDWNAAVDTDSPPVTYEVYREECLAPLIPGLPCDNFGYIPNASNFLATTPQSYFADMTIGASGQAKKWLYTVRARDSATFFNNKEWNFGKRVALGNSASPETPPPQTVGDTLRFAPGSTTVFTWSDPTGAINYGFYRTTNKSTYSSVPTLPLLIVLTAANNDGNADGYTDTTFTDTATPPLGQSYYYKVSARDTCGGETLSEILP